MALLPDNERQELAAHFMRELSEVREPCALLKAQVRQFVNETDDWINANASSFNLSLSASIRSLLTASQKSRGFRTVARRRNETGA